VSKSYEAAFRETASRLEHGSLLRWEHDVPVKKFLHSVLFSMGHIMTAHSPRLEDTFCEAALVTSDMLSRAVSDCYRCSKTFLEFELSGQLSSDNGFFEFGPRITCYGRTSSGVRSAQVTSSLYDMQKEVVADQGLVKLPFDPGEIIDNLRLERYVDGWGTGNISLSRFKRMYYHLRPFTNLFVRKQIQKFYGRNWRDLPFPRWPVDTTVEDICKRLFSLSMEAKGVESVPFVWFWPNGARGCLLMTHDVETESGRDYCGELMDLDDSFGIKASFQVVPEGRYSVSPAFLDSIRKRGFDYGIQDLNHDGRLFDSREEFLRRADLINRYAAQHAVKGFRAAVLYRKPEWFDRLNFSYDMSIPNVARVDPQRGGCCTVMPYFIGEILELPVTTTQDYTLFHLLNERSIDLWKTQMELILEKNGLVSFIIHPDYVIEAEARSVYVKLLDHLRKLHAEKHLWLALPTEIDSWWRARSKMAVEKIGNSWRVVGEQADRAVLAFAKNVGGKLIYEFARAGNDA
jgi:hypothetical protein